MTIEFARSCEVMETHLDEIAGVMGEYKKSLIERGFTEDQAMKLVLQYHELMFTDINQMATEGEK